MMLFSFKWRRVPLGSSLLLLFLIFYMVQSVHLDYEKGHKKKKNKSSSWCYSLDECKQDDSASKWQMGVCKDGERQSPINIEPENLKTPDKGSLKEGNVILTPKQRKNYDLVEFTLFTANKSIHVDNFTTATGQEATFSWDGAKYKLERVHFHWGPANETGSEHTINGTGYNAEMHMIHYKSGTSNGKDNLDNRTNGYLGPKEAFDSGKPDAFSVIAILFQYNDQKSRKKRSPVIPQVTDTLNKKKSKPEPHSSVTILEPIVSSLDRLNQTEEAHIRVHRTLKFGELLKFQKVYTYSGSLTTPACNEVVHWIILEKPVKVKAAHLHSLREHGKEEGGGKLSKNCRKIQNNKNPDGSRRPVKRISIDKE